jgi:hypothetical protein
MRESQGEQIHLVEVSLEEECNHRLIDFGLCGSYRVRQQEFRCSGKASPEGRRANADV